MFRILLCNAILCLSCIVFAEVTNQITDFTTEPKPKTQRSRADLKTQYVDKLGNDWSEILPRQHTNGCSTWGESGQIDCDNKTAIDHTSMAFSACSQRGWRLPTRQDWDSLITEFDFKEHVYGRSLTKKGQTDFNKKFNTTKLDMYASATVSGGNFYSHSFAFATYWTADVIQKSIDNNSLDATKETFSALGREKPQSIICIRSNVPTS